MFFSFRKIDFNTELLYRRVIREVYAVKFKNYFSFIILAGIINFSNISYAAMPDAANVKEVHKGATVGCTVCHPEGNFKQLWQSI